MLATLNSSKMGPDAGCAVMWHFGLPVLVSADPSCQLVKPCDNVPLPVLEEVGLQDHAIPAGRHGGCLQAFL